MLSQLFSSLATSAFTAMLLGGFLRPFQFSMICPWRLDHPFTDREYYCKPLWFLCQDSLSKSGHFCAYWDCLRSKFFRLLLYKRSFSGFPGLPVSGSGQNYTATTRWVKGIGENYLYEFFICSHPTSTPKIRHETSHHFDYFDGNLSANRINFWSSIH
jgi:hypothetical protein